MKCIFYIISSFCSLAILLKIVFQFVPTPKIIFNSFNIEPTNYLYTIPLFDFEKGETPLQIGNWPGTDPGVLVDGELRRGHCSTYDEQTCSSLIGGKDPKPLSKWKGKHFMISQNFSSYTYINLLNSSVLENEECPPNLKQCGFLDTLNHKLCLAKEEECPINMMIMKNSSEPPENYSYSFKKIGFNDGSYLFYTNEAIDQHIIAELLISEFTICFNPYEYNLFNYVLYKNRECYYSTKHSRFNNNYTLLDTMDLSLLYEDNNITSIIEKLPEFPLEEIKNEKTQLFYRTFVGYNKECMKNKQTKFFKSLSHEVLSIIIFFMSILESFIFIGVLGVTCIYCDKGDDISEKEEKREKENHSLLLNSLLIGIFYSIPVLIFMILLYYRLIYILHDYLSCSNGAYDLFYYREVKEKYKTKWIIVSFYFSPVYIVFFSILYIIRRKIQEDNKKKKEKQQKELLLKKDFEYLTKSQ